MTEAEEAQRSALEAREAALEARESRLDAAKAKMETDYKKEVLPGKTEPVNPPVDDSRKMLDEQMLALLRSPGRISPKSSFCNPGPTAPASEKHRLQKVYKLFKWTNQAVKKVGHDRLEIILRVLPGDGVYNKRIL